MKVPKTMRTYCPKCKTHTESSVSIYKPGKRTGAKKGERRQATRKKGYGGQKFRHAKSIRSHHQGEQSESQCGHLDVPL